MARSSLQVANEEYMAEFPFIRPWVKEVERFGRPPKVKVQKLDLDVLFSRPYAVEGRQLRYFCIGYEGQVLFEVSKKEILYSKFSLWRPRTWFGHRVDGQTVDEAMFDFGFISQIAYVVCVDDYPEGLITIYKIPETFSFAHFIRAEEERIRRDAREKLKKESGETE